MEQDNFALYPSLKDRVVLVTGGSTGIGESLVRHFARQGSRVAFFDVQDEPGKALAEALATEGCLRPEYMHCDLAYVPAVQAAVAQVLARFGTVDVLVNNAANDQRHQTE